MIRTALISFGASLGLAAVLVAAHQSGCEGYALKSGVCISPAVLESTFAGYTLGTPAPMDRAEQIIITVQRQWSEDLQKRKVCEGQLAPLQGQQDTSQLDQQQAALDKRLNLMCAAIQQVWNPTAKQCAKAPQ